MGRASDDLGYFAGTQATCANTDVFARAIDQNVHPLQVRPLDALGFNVRVADCVSHLSLLAANFTLRWHGFSSKGG
jgi:hypothetical protein